MNPRQLNGAEDAQDYLWLTQDLWMEPDVWDWADKDADTKKSVRRMCCREGCEKVESSVSEFRRCSACMSVWYCAPDCQKRDWKTHKPSEFDSILSDSYLCSLYYTGCREHNSIKMASKAFAAGKSMPSDAPIVALADFMGCKVYTNAQE